MNALENYTIRTALDKLHEYAHDDPLDAARLKPVIDAHEKGDFQAFMNACVDVLPTYCACHCAIDDLYSFAWTFTKSQTPTH